MTARSVAALVALGVTLAMPSPAPAPACQIERFRCRDGAATGLFTVENPPIFGGRAAYYRQHRDASCDFDRRCDGVCTFDRSAYPDKYPIRLAVGERRDVGGGDEYGCSTRYV